jgi:hypothetical protein
VLGTTDFETLAGSTRSVPVPTLFTMPVAEGRIRSRNCQLLVARYRELFFVVEFEPKCNVHFGSSTR